MNIKASLRLTKFVLLAFVASLIFGLALDLVVTHRKKPMVVEAGDILWLSPHYYHVDKIVGDIVLCHMGMPGDLFWCPVTVESGDLRFFRRMSHQEFEQLRYR